MTYRVPWTALLLIALLLLAGCGQSGLPTSEAASSGTIAASPTRAVSEAAQASGGKTAQALRRAADAGKYLFVFFWKTEDDQTRAMRPIFDQTLKKLGERALGVVVNVTDPAERDVVERYGLDRAPMPLVLAFAPNGAITGGFPTEFTEEQLLAAFATPCEAKCLKALQENKLVLLCVQNDKTKSNEAAMKGVSAFTSDERFAAATRVVMLDPADEAEAPFLAKLQVPADTETAVTVLLAPPGMVIGAFKGATTQAMLELALAQASSGCCSGGACGSGGCQPQ